MKYLATICVILFTAVASFAQVNAGAVVVDGTAYMYLATIDPSTGAAADATGSPSYRCYTAETSTPFATGSFSLLDSSNTDGLYSEAVSVSGLSANTQVVCYILATVGTVSNAPEVLTFQVAPPVDTQSIADNAIKDTTYDSTTAIYQAKVVLLTDNAGTTDLYLVSWFKNGEPIYSGITSPTIQVVKASDGSDLVASTSLTQIATTGFYKYSEATNRITAGSGYVAKVTATIDSSSRTWSQPVGRDTQ